MTRKILILFIALMLVSFSLISSVLGERGIIVNNRLRKQLAEKEYELDRRDMEIENLRLQDNELSTEDGSRSTAMSFGYQVEGDDVHVFETEDEVSRSTSAGQERKSEDEKEFTPWGIPFILLISFCSSFIITVIVWLFAKRKGKTDDSQQEESGDIGDNLNFDT
ncbi:MAG: hypothetical protein LIR25_01210 [bacterium]|jgi:cell division protein FtsB|nr:hypothetical protein [Spirochaetales bacterium]MDT3389207.1 hypothetical protein [bacterium]